MPHKARPRPRAIALGRLPKAGTKLVLETNLKIKQSTEEMKAMTLNVGKTSGRISMKRVSTPYYRKSER